MAYGVRCKKALAKRPNFSVAIYVRNALRHLLVPCQPPHEPPYRRGGSSDFHRACLIILEGSVTIAMEPCLCLATNAQTDSSLCLELNWYPDPLSPLPSGFLLPSLWVGSPDPRVSGHFFSWFPLLLCSTSSSDFLRKSGREFHFLRSCGPAGVFFSPLIW